MSTTTATERFALALRGYVDERMRMKGPLYDQAGEEAKALERVFDAFNAAVDERVQQAPSRRAQTMTYTERPPASARAARAAWDYFTARKPGSRRIEALFYSPKCDGERAWVAELETLETDAQHWGTSYTDSWRTLTATPYEIRGWLNAS